MSSARFTTPVKLESYSKDERKVYVYRTLKIGTNRKFYFVVNEKNERIGSTLWSSKWQAVGLGKNYLINI